MFVSFLRDDEGVTSMEYALIASLIGLAIIGSLLLLGEETATLYDQVATLLIQKSS